MKTKEPLSYRGKYLLLAVMPVYFMIAGLFCQPVDEIFSGLIAILREPDFLITDYFVVGGVGAAFFNAGTVTLILLVFLYCIRMEFDGHTITSCCLLFGFSLFGKNLLNIWAILFGVFLYARCHRVSIRNHLYVGLYGTSLSPIITQVMQIGHLPLAGRLVLSVVVGICIGFVLPPLSAHVRDIHKGYSLYNVGFSAGIIATVVISLFKSFGITVESRLIWDESHNTLFGILLSVFFVGMIVFALAREKTCVLKKYWQILKCSGIGGTDYWKDYGDYAVLFNMGVNGLFATGFVLAVGGDLNGPTIGGIFTIVGFSSTGKHLRNIAPIMIGVYLASLTKHWSINEPAPLLALLFSTTLAPIAGEFGVFAGLVAGFLHSSVALNVGIVYSGMNLYNNGFAGGLVAAFMVPVILSFRSRMSRIKNEDIL